LYRTRLLLCHCYAYGGTEYWPPTDHVLGPHLKETPIGQITPAQTFQQPEGVAPEDALWAVKTVQSLDREPALSQPLYRLPQPDGVLTWPVVISLPLR